MKTYSNIGTGSIVAFVPIVCLWVLFAALILLGGDSRSDFQGLIFLYPTAVLLAATAVGTAREPGWPQVRAPLLLVLGISGIAVLQLIPLPPALWQMLPQRETWVAGSRLFGVEPGWLPLTVSPTLTRDTLAALVVPASFLIALASVPVDHSRKLAWGVLGAILLSAFLGAAQYAAGELGGVSLYTKVTTADAIGLFANRNHQAVFLSLAPAVASIVFTTGTFKRRRAHLALPVFVAVSLFVGPIVLMVGSRAGAFSFAFGLVASGLVLWRRSEALSQLTKRFGARNLGIGVVALILSAGAVVASMGRMVASERVLTTDVGADLRWRALPTILDIWSDHWLFGTGFGTFDPVYRIYEPLDLLSQSYLNHAHNDLLEIALCGGAVALLVLAIFGWWLIRQVIAAFRTGDAYARGAAICLIQILGASLFDYPLRTPLLMGVFMLGCVWLSSGAARTKVLYPLRTGG